MASKSHLGIDFEELINKSNQYYLEKDLCVIHKKPTPITINKVDYKSRCDAVIKEAHFKIPSTTDYNGIYKGKYIDFEAKETKCTTSFPLNNIHDHQIKHLNMINEMGGIGFIIVYFKKVIPDLVIDSAVLTEPKKNAEVASPGMKYKHYAPKADVTLIEGESAAFINYCNENSDIDFALCFDEDINKIAISAVSYGSKNDFEKQAENLFKSLRDIDKKGFKKVVVHAPDKREMGLAVYNRLIRAAGFKVIKL